MHRDGKLRRGGITKTKTPKPADGILLFSTSETKIKVVYPGSVDNTRMRGDDLVNGGDERMNGRQRLQFRSERGIEAYRYLAPNATE